MNNHQNYNMPKQSNNYMNNYNSSNLYEPYQGFIRGNMFPNLYSEYKLNSPYNIEPLNEQATLLTYIDSFSFAAHDLNLFLDVYPDDKNALSLFNQYRTEGNRLTKEYESKYGPLFLNSDSLESYPWAWNNMPWPWDTK